MLSACMQNLNGNKHASREHPLTGLHHKRTRSPQSIATLFKRRVILSDLASSPSRT
jgi:hypothetical protein